MVCLDLLDTWESNCNAEIGRKAEVHIETESLGGGENGQSERAKEKLLSRQWASGEEQDMSSWEAGKLSYVDNSR